MYEATLRAARKVGASHADDAQLMALLCDSTVQLLCGAVSPKLVWAGARAKGLNTADLARLMNSDPGAVADLMWV